MNVLELGAIADLGRRMKADGHRTRMLVEQIPSKEEENIPIS